MTLSTIRCVRVCVCECVSAAHHGVLLQEDDEDAMESAKDTFASMKKMLGIEDQVNPVDGVWFDTYQTDPKTKKREFRGRILISLELLPKAVADKYPAGLGRSDPNVNPTLPPPTGRLKFVRAPACQ